MTITAQMRMRYRRAWLREGSSNRRWR